MKYTKFYSTRAESLFCSLNLLFHVVVRRRCRCRRDLLKVPNMKWLSRTLKNVKVEFHVSIWN